MDGDDPTQEVTGEASTVRSGGRGVLRSRLGGERYHLGEPIGKGGMGEVLVAFDTQIGREVAIKRMLERDASDLAMTRFFREASIQGRLDHPSIVPVYELGVDDDGRPFFAMKKLAGTTLRELIRAGESRQRLLRAFADACLAVEFAHTRGVVHRDLKPPNIVLGDFGDVYVLDWGVAKLLRGDDPPGSSEPAASGELATKAGTRIGTLPYMAPEQLEDARGVDARADVYALGCMLFEILAGEPLHQGGRAHDAVIDARPSVRAPGRDIPPELDDACVAATAPLAARIATARELGERVQRYLDGDRDLAHRQQLARDHLATARAALATADDVARARAFREAGRALALDPTLPAAGELVGRLMLELPTTTPPEVVRAMKMHDVFTIRALARASAWAFTGFLWLVPGLVAMAPGHPAYAAAVGAAIVLLGAFVAGGGFGTVARSARLAVGSAVLVAVFGLALSPLIAAPCMAVVLAIALTASPTYTRWRMVIVVAAVMAVAPFVRWLVEAAGGLAPSIAFGDGTIVIAAPGLDVSPSIGLLVLVMSVVGPVVAAACLGHAWRRAENEVFRRLHLHAWQLGQLVADVA